MPVIALVIVLILARLVFAYYAGRPAAPTSKHRDGAGRIPRAERYHRPRR